MSASEAHSPALTGGSVAEAVVACYAHADAARSDGIALVVELRHCDTEAPERVAQLVGALIDAGAERIVVRSDADAVGPAAQRVLHDAFTHAHIGAQRIEW